MVFSATFSLHVRFDTISQFPVVHVIFTKMTDLSEIPLVALSIDTRTLVSTLLNPTKWMPTDDGVPRDWRGLAHLCDLGGETIPSLASHSDPTGQIISIIQTKTPNSTLTDFQSILSKIDRWDVIDDANPLFEKDAEKYLERMERCGTSAGDIETDSDKQILTIDDLYRFRQGLDKQYYDACLLYAEQDMEFVTEMIENLEKKYQMKLCIKDRDLVGGITFEHEAVMQLISERCNRLIVVISPDFLKSPANKFFLNYAQAVGIESRQRKIIPCVYKKCQLPRQLSYTFILDYGRVGLYDFWGRLRDSVRVVAVENASNRGLPTQQSVQKDEKLRAIQNEDNLNSSKNNDACSDTNSPFKPINDTTSSPISNVKPAKSKRGKVLIPWPKKKRETVAKNHEKDPETATEIISHTVSLPSLENLPTLEIMKSTSSGKSTKRKKNLVDSCVKKVQALLSK